MRVRGFFFSALQSSMDIKMFPHGASFSFSSQSFFFGFVFLSVKVARNVIMQTLQLLFAESHSCVSVTWFLNCV